MVIGRSQPYCVQFPTSRNPPLPYACFDVSTTGSNAALNNFSMDPANIVTCFSTRSQQVLVSRDWFASNFGTAPNLMGVYDGCMIQKSAPCLALSGAIIPNRGMC